MISTASPRIELAAPTPPPVAPPYCPACGGALLPLRGDYRCTRCFLPVCFGCEPAPVGGAAPGDC